MTRKIVEAPAAPVTVYTDGESPEDDIPEPPPRRKRETTARARPSITIPTLRRLNVSQVAILMGKPRRTITDWCTDGVLPAEKPHGVWLIDPIIFGEVPRCPHCEQPLPRGMVLADSKANSAKTG